MFVPLGTLKRDLWAKFRQILQARVLERNVPPVTLALVTLPVGLTVTLITTVPGPGQVAVGKYSNV